jgi:hypothetical protein
VLWQPPLVPDVLRCFTGQHSVFSSASDSTETFSVLLVVEGGEVTRDVIKAAVDADVPVVVWLKDPGWTARAAL